MRGNPARTAIRRFVSLLAIGLGLAGPADALQREAVPVPDDLGESDWAAASTCATTYYNICTGWVWIWDGWETGDVVGITLGSCSRNDPHQLLDTVNLYAWEAAPSGYGLTGTLTVSRQDANGCPGAPVASQPLLPATGNNVIALGLPMVDVTLTYRHGGETTPEFYEDPTTWVTDHPGAGPTGPTACGLCYPTTRTPHSFLFALQDEILCPGQPFDSGTCTPELYGWGATYRIVDYVEPSSWAKVKHLYR